MDLGLAFLKTENLGESDDTILKHSINYPNSTVVNIKSEMLTGHLNPIDFLKTEKPEAGEDLANNDIGYFKKPTEPETFRCYPYDFQTITEFNLRAHASGHMRQRDLACKTCDYKTHSKRALHEHTRNHSEAKKYRCQMCDYSTNSRRYFHAHVNNHLGINDFGCDACDFKTNYKANFKKHLPRCRGKPANENDRVKQEPKAPIFKKPLNEKEVLQWYTHGLQTISKSYARVRASVDACERDLACEVCDYTTYSKRALREHIRNHNYAKKFRCELCDYKTNSRRYYHAHVNNHAGINDFVCDACDYKTNYKANFKKHLPRCRGTIANENDHVKQESKITEMTRERSLDTCFLN